MSVPNWIDKPAHKKHWQRPWGFRARHSPSFKKRLWQHGYLSPHFTRAEAGSKGDTCGCHPTQIPYSKRRAAQRHAFRLEIARHKLGDKSMSPLSWYRSTCHNNCVGGAGRSRHVEADATDWSDSERARLGGTRFDTVMIAVFARGGIGTICGTRHVRHVDSRGFPARWCY